MSDLPVAFLSLLEGWHNAEVAQCGLSLLRKADRRGRRAEGLHITHELVFRGDR